jgi:class 3 adenylate cyclase
MPDDPITPSPQFLERKLATILSADVAEFSRLMGEDEEQTLRVFRGHKQIFESLVAMHRGRVFNTAGDAILAEFGSAVEAVRCATDIQTALRTANDKLPLSRQVRFRMGINLGDVMVQGQDLLGDGVNVASRLQTAAEPGGICISGSVHDQIRNKLSLSFQSLGERTYKNIQQPVRTFSVTESEDGGTIPSHKPKGPPAGSLKWIIAAVVLLLLGAGAFWALTFNKRRESPLQTTNSVPAPSPASTESSPQPTAPAPVSPQPQPATESAPPIAATPKPEAKSQPRHVAPAAAAAAPVATGVATAPTSSAGPSGPYDGQYGGPVCYEQTLMEPKHCARGQATVHGGKIVGKWATGREGALTMFLVGDISPSGEAKMELHSEKPDGSRVVTIDLKGTFESGRLDATGSFRRIGRPVNLSWHKLPTP